MILFVDIDDTMRATNWRKGYIEESWDKFHSMAMADAPIKEIIHMVNCLHIVGWNTIGLTAVPEKWRQLTMGWLNTNQCYLTSLLMRPDNDFRPAPTVKLELVEHYLEFSGGSKDECVLIDDRDDIVEAFKAIGIHAMQLHARM